MEAEFVVKLTVIASLAMRAVWVVQTTATIHSTFIPIEFVIKFILG